MKERPFLQVTLVASVILALCHFCNGGTQDVENQELNMIFKGNQASAIEKPEWKILRETGRKLQNQKKINGQQLKRTSRNQRKQRKNKKNLKQNKKKSQRKGKKWIHYKNKRKKGEINYCYSLGRTSSDTLCKPSFTTSFGGFCCLRRASTFEDVINALVPSDFYCHSIENSNVTHCPSGFELCHEKYCCPKICPPTETDAAYSLMTSKFSISCTTCDDYCDKGASYIKEFLCPLLPWPLSSACNFLVKHFSKWACDKLCSKMCTKNMAPRTADSESTSDDSIKAPVPTEAWLTQCGDLMKSENVFENFSDAVSHGIHSLTLQDIRAYFNKSAIIENGIPTANRNLEAPEEEIILPNAPDIPGLFNSIGMHTLDIALQNMDLPNNMMKTGILTRLSHAYHMQEFWAAAQPFYQQYQESGVDSNVCACALDREGNGINQGLKNSFNFFKKSNFSTSHGGTNCVLFCKYSLKASPTDREIIKNENDLIPALTSSETWDLWRNYISISMPGDDDIKKFALFMYCALA